MAGAAREFVLKIIADVTDATKGLSTLEDSTQTTAQKMGGVAKTVAAGVATAAVLKFGKDCLDAAGDADAAMDKVASVFGDSAGEIEKFSKNTADSMGLSSSQFQAMAAQSGALMQSVGINADDAAKRTENMSQRAADLAAIYGGDASKAMDAFDKAMTGQTKSLKEYGIVISAADIDARAMAEGYVDASGKVTDAGKAIASQELILEKSSKQAGAFADNAGDLGSQQQILAAKMTNLKETIGTALLPVVERLISLVQPFMNFMTSNISWIAPLAAGIAALAVGMKAWSAATEIWSGVQKVATAVQWAFNAAMTANPIGIIIVAITALVAAFVLLYTKVDWFRAGVDAMVDGVVAAFQWLWDMIQKVYNWIADNWPLLLAILTGPIGIAVKLIVDNWDAIKRGFSVAWDAITMVMGTVFDILTAPYRKAWEIIRGIIDGIPAAFRTAVTAVSNALSTVWDTISSPFKKGWDLVKSAGQTVIDWFGTIHNTINNAFSGLADVIKYPFTQAFNAIKSLWNSTVGGFRFEVPSWVPGVGGKGFSIPRMASGGIVTRPTIALIGEAGPEAVVPLNGSTGFGSVTINVYALTANAEVGRKVYEALEEYSRISGKRVA